MKEENCDACENGIEAVIAHQEFLLRTKGWYAHAVPCNYHTHGLPMSFDHLDIQVTLPIDPAQVHSVVCLVVEMIKEGKKFHSFTRYSGILKNMEVTFVGAIESGHSVLRMILPDANGSLDREEMDILYAEQYDNLGDVCEGCGKPTINGLCPDHPEDDDE